MKYNPYSMRTLRVSLSFTNPRLDVNMEFFDPLLLQFFLLLRLMQNFCKSQNLYQCKIKCERGTHGSSFSRTTPQKFHIYKYIQLYQIKWGSSWYIPKLASCNIYIRIRSHAKWKILAHFSGIIQIKGVIIASQNTF